MKLQIVTITAILGSASAFTLSSTGASSTGLAAVNNGENFECSRRDSLAALFTTTLTLATAAPAFAREARPEYLTEPTDAFKESEKQRDEFRRKQLRLKKEFTTVLDRFTFESKTTDAFVEDLKDLKTLVQITEGLPLGIKKDDLVKIIRAKKAKGLWPTDVEYAYQSLIREIAYQQSPNKDKDIGNPL
eukprot:CAMPEP_0194100358 /NCGR_PEP_ID=MMETSP0150-20130528/1240_1 /TAXON_ID=122233 /ORGANISM="Chaetoceros debilis, Strain MM31A-1" /LENGTH=188 /DNA_ID=CAMNT_0038786709 /DNA_START=78 /DNA_END=644 /DNA_ORIENTATION=+